MINLSIPFETLTDMLKTLGYADQQRLLSFLETEIAAAEEAIIDGDDQLRNEILEARAAYATGEYVTLGEYVAKQDRID